MSAINTYNRIKQENFDYRNQIYRLLNEPRYYLSQAIMKGFLKPLQELKEKEIAELTYLRDQYFIIGIKS